MGKEQGAEQTWALGTVEGSPKSIELVSLAGERSVIASSGLKDQGVPMVRGIRRVPYEGDLSLWREGSAQTYLEGLGLHIKGCQDHRHQVFVLHRGKGKMIHVPALTLIRAFYDPIPVLLPALFHPVGMDRLSFVNYAQTPIEVVADELDTVYKSQLQGRYATAAKKALSWLQLSQSARSMTQSVWLNAYKGHLRFSLPAGRVRILFYGRGKGDDFFATKAVLLSMCVPAEDSLTGHEETFVMRDMPEATVKRSISCHGIQVPRHRDGTVSLTSAEREMVQPVLRGRPRGPARELRWDELDLVLKKLATGQSWSEVTAGSKTVVAGGAASAFRYWQTDGRLGEILGMLRKARALEGA